MARMCSCLLVLGLAGLASMAGPLWGQQLVERPVARGGDPVGVWEADGVPIQAYVPPEVLAAISTLTFSGSVTGLVRLLPNREYASDFILASQASLSFLGVPIQVEFSDTTRAEGTYQQTETLLIFLPNDPVLDSDTLRYTASDDSLTLIQPIPLGQFEALVSGIVPPEDPPLAMFSLRKIEELREPAEITADFNGDSRVDFADFLQFAGSFGKESGEEGYDPILDISGNGKIDFPDFLALAGQFGRSK